MAERRRPVAPGSRQTAGENPEELLLWSRCESCGQRETCPYVLGRLISQLASQGRASAEYLREQTCRLRETISTFDDVQHLLNGDRDIECALSCALQQELRMLDRFRAEREMGCR